MDYVSIWKNQIVKHVLNLKHRFIKIDVYLLQN